MREIKNQNDLTEGLMKFEEYIDSEKNFLHDLSNQLVVLDSISRHLQSKELISSEVLSAQDKIYLEKLSVIVSKIVLGVQGRKKIVLAQMNG